MAYTADATNLLSPADGDYIVNGPAEIRAIKVRLDNAIVGVVPFTAALYVVSDTTLTAAQSGLTILLERGLITLPAPASSSGTRFRIVSVGASLGTIQTPSGQLFYPDTSTTSASSPVSMAALSSGDIISDGINWLVTSMSGDLIIRSSTRSNSPARIDQVLGIGQTYQNVTSNRVSGVSYYNANAKSIVVYATTNPGWHYDATCTATVGGVSFIVSTDSNSGGGNTSAGSVIVPPNTWYSLVASGSGVSGFSSWLELR